MGFAAAIAETWELMKSPPGPPPRPGLEWKEETSRWIRPEEAAAASKPKHARSRISEMIWDTPYVVDELNRLGNEVALLFDAEKAPSYVNARDSWPIEQYTMEGYAELNERLRFGESLGGESRELAEGLEGVMQPLGVPQVLYRGVSRDILKGGGEGATVQMDTYMSCSRNPATAIEFTYSSMDGVLLEMDAGPGVYGATLSNNDTEFAEDETILAAGQQLEIQMIEEWPSADGGSVMTVVKGRVGA